MNALSHMFKKDGRRLGIPLLLWCVLFGLTVWGSLDQPPPTLLAPLIQTGVFAATALYWILTIVISALIILEDPPKGTTAFWLTRPLSRTRVAAAKLCLLSVIIVLPILVDVVVMGWGGASGRIMTAAFLSKMMARVPLVLGIAAFAVTAESFGQFAINTLLILIGTGLTAALVVAGRTAWRYHHLVPHAVVENTATLGSSRMIVSEIIVTGFAVILILWRYTRPQARFALTAVSAAALVSILTPMFWEFDFLGSPSTPTASTADVEFHLLAPRPEQWMFFRKGAGLKGSIEAAPDTSGNILVPTYVAEMTLIWPDGTKTHLPGHQFLPSNLGVASDPDALVSLMAPLRILNLPKKNSTPFFVPLRGGPSRERLAEEPAKLEATVNASARRFETVAELPLRTGAKAALRNRQLELTEFRSSEAETSLQLQEGFFPSILARELDRGRTPNSFNFGQRAPETLTAGDSRIFLLINRARGEAVLALSQRDETEKSWGGYIVRSEAVEFKQAALDDDWLKDASLMVLNLAEVGRASVHLAAERVTLAP